MLNCLQLHRSVRKCLSIHYVNCDACLEAMEAFQMCVCVCLCMHVFVYVCIFWGSLLVRVPDSWLKGWEFESWQEQQENFLLQSELCVPTLFRCPFHPGDTSVACKRPWSYCQKCRWQVTPKHACTLDSTKSEWVNYTTVQA